MKKYNFVYKTTNLVNGKVYIGVHSTNNLEDGYIGCGIYRNSDAINKAKKTRFYGFASAVTRYGYDNFKTTILKFFKTKEEAYIYESKIVTEKFINSDKTYNIKIGGECAPNSKGIKRTETFKKQKSTQIKTYMGKLVSIHSKEFVIVDIQTNETYHIKNLASFCKSKKLSEHGLSSVARKKAQLYKKRWWACYKEEWVGQIILNKGLVFKEPVVLYHKDGRVLTVKTLKDATVLTKADKSALSKLIKGKVNQVAGWSCKKW
jgi:hypothetical protein